MEIREKFDQWALVELFGHQRIAGRVTEAEIGGCKFVRVDVPQLGELQPLTKFLGQGSIYGITPVTEETALGLAAQIKAAPISSWDARSILEKPERSQRQLVASDEDEEETEDDIPY